MKNLIVSFLLCTGALSALTPPTELSVVSATNLQVQLIWKAAGADATQYVIERRSLESSTYAPVFTVIPDPADTKKILPTSFTDKAFDAFTAYVYRIRAINATVTPADTSDSTNEVTVGPPPPGYTRVVATLDNLDDPGLLGVAVQMILDRSGDPMLSYLNLDPDHDGVFTDTEIRYMRWDRAHYTWTTPVRVVVPGDIDSSYGYNYSSRLAFDASTGALGIVFIDRSKPIQQVVLADSADNGVTWRTRTIASNPTDFYEVPALAMGAGNVYITFLRDYEGLRYLTGKLSDNPNAWSSELLPLLDAAGYGLSSDIALDSAGKPGIAYLVLGDDNQRVLFYRPGSAPMIANTSVSGPGDDWQLRLAFAGASPRIAFSGRMDDHFFEDYDHSVFFMSATDAGTTWNPIVNIKSDGNRFIGGPMSVSIDSAGRAAVTTHDSGGNDGGVVCGAPKLSLSSDLKVWNTCGISSTIISRDGTSDVKFAFNDTLYLTFTIPAYPFDAKAPEELAAGVYFWRGPVGFQFPTPPPVR